MEMTNCSILCDYMQVSWSRVVPYLAGYSYSFFVGGFFIRSTLDELKKKLKFHDYNKDEIKTCSWYARRVGDIEIVIYVTSFLINKPEFIAVWLALKVAGRWHSAKLEADSNKYRDQQKLTKTLKSSNSLEEKFESIQHNGFCNIFTIGTGLSIAYGFIGSKIILWFKNSMDDKVIALILTAIVVNTALYISAKKQNKRLERLAGKLKK